MKALRRNARARWLVSAAAAAIGVSAAHAAEGPEIGRVDGLVVYRHGEGVRGVYGPLAAGSPSGAVSAARAIERAVGILGVRAEDLSPEPLPGRPDHGCVVLGGNAQGRSPVLIYTFVQTIAGLPVLGTRVGVLVQDCDGFPAVAIKANTRRLGGFVPRPGVIEHPAVAAAIASGSRRVPGLFGVSDVRLAVWAGTDVKPEPARLVVEYLGDVPVVGSDVPERVRVTADAGTGEALVVESLRCDADIQVTTQGVATTGLKADTCAGEVATPLGGVGVVLDGTTYQSDASGNLTIPWAGTAPVTLTAQVAGDRFATHRQTGGADETLTLTITPPGPAAFLFNATNSTADYRSAVNAFAAANGAYDFIAAMTPWIAQSECSNAFDIYVHRSGGEGGASFTPPKGDHCSDGSRAYISLGAASGAKPAASYATPVYHEYGHHIGYLQGVRGASAFNEGMADVVAIMVSDQPDLFVGTAGDCVTPLRSGENTMTWPCYDPVDVHTCAGLLSGCFWELRKNLGATHPSTYRQVLAELALGSLALHVSGEGVGPEIFLDVLALDNGGVLPTKASGSPHWNEIQAAFEAHRMTIADFEGAGSDLQGSALAFGFPAPPPESVWPWRAASVEFSVSALYGNVPVDGGATLYVDAQGDGVFVAQGVTRVGANHYVASIPALSCGQRARYYLGVQTTGGREARWPNGAPDVCATVGAWALAETVQAFAFDADMEGWTPLPTLGFGTQYPLTGLLNTGDRYPTAGPDVTLTQALFVENIPMPDGVTDASCRATSPPIDTRGHGAAMVSYARWFYDESGIAAMKDYVTVEVSLDDGQTWSVLDQAGPSGSDIHGGWRYRSFVITPAPATRLRVYRHDAGVTSQSLVMVDNVVVSAVKCCPSDFDDNGFVNADDYDFFSDAFVAGDTSADFDGNGFVNGDDYDAFMDAFAAGC